jgi:hypothetical protein
MQIRQSDPKECRSGDKDGPMRFSFLRSVIGAGLITSLFGVIPAQAQLNTQHVKGLAGLKAGSPDTVKDRQGDLFGPSADLTSVAFAAGFVKVTTTKILGGFYSYQVLFPVIVNNRIQGTEIDQRCHRGVSADPSSRHEQCFALGPEVSMAIARKGVLYGFLKFNYEWETYARTTTQGSEFNVTFTLAAKPIKLP